MRAGRQAAALAVACALAWTGASTGPATAQQRDGEIVAPAVRDVTPPGVLPGPEVEGPLIREAVKLPAADPARWHRFFLPATTDAATFVTDRMTIRVSGVTPPAADRMCPAADGADWPCGRTALYRLRMFLRGRAIECYFPFASDMAEVVAPCRVGPTDIGLWLLEQGWAEAGDLATDAYRDAEHAARCAGLGLWRGTRPPDDCPAG